MTRRPMAGRRRRPQGMAGFRMVSSCLCVALAALTARAPSRLLTHAFLLNSNIAGSTRNSRAPPSTPAWYSSGASRCCRMWGGESSGSTAMRGDSSSLFVVEEGSSRSLAGTMARQRGATATSRPSATALAAAASSGDGGVGGGDDADEGSSVGGVWAVQDEDEWEFEEEVQRLEERLEAAVKHEDYKGASKCRDELYRIHMDETSAVLSTNSAFYAAFTAKDADRMTSLWMPSNDVMCIHPGDEPVVGQQAVARSWRSLFRSGDSRFSSSVIKPTEVRVRVRGTTAIVQCNEEVTTRTAPSSSSSASSSSLSSLDTTSKSDEGGPAADWLAQVIADNPYEPGSDKSVGGSPATAEDRARIKKAVGKHGVASIKKAVDTAFAESSAAGKGKGAAGGGGGRKKKPKPRFLNVTNIYRKAGGRWLMVHHHASLPPPAQSSSERRAAMGIDGLKDGMEGMTRIINLSDMGGSGFVGGGGGGGGKDNKLEEMLEALRNRLPGGLPGGIGGTGSGRAASSGMIIIGDTDDDDDDDEEEDDEDEEEDDDEEEEEDSDDDDDDDHDVTDVTSSSGSSVEGKEKGGSRWGKEELPLTEDLTKKTVQALRTLVEIDLLEKGDQRRLMTDVIQHASGDEASAVEVAYELLLAHTNENLEDNDSLAEFVDQCKILAASLYEDDKKKRRWRRR